MKAKVMELVKRMVKDRATQSMIAMALTMVSERDIEQAVSELRVMLKAAWTSEEFRALVRDRYKIDDETVNNFVG